MKKYKIMFWCATTAIFLFEGVMPAATFNSEMAKQGVTGLGYPLYFGTALALAKIIGTLALMIPQVPARVKEWAYAGFGFDFIFAFISLVAVMGLTGVALLPVVFFAILVVSYVSYHKLNPGK